jgi:hypothetical protein
MAVKAVLLNDTSSKHHYGCRLVVDRIKAHCAATGIEISHCVKVGEDWRSPEHFPHIVSTQMVIVNGEGTLHHSRQKVLGLVSSAQFCHERNIKSFLINSVYQDNSDEIADMVRLFDLVFVRETRSQEALAAQGIRAQVVPDMSLSLPFSTAEYGGRRTGNIFTDSVVEELANRLYEVSKHAEDSQFVTLRVPSTDKSITRKASDIGRSLKLRNLGDGHTGKKGRLESSELPFRRATHATLAELLHHVATSRCVVTGRFHMVCLALLTKTPFLALPSNTYKIEGLLNDVGLKHRFISCEKVHQLLPQLSCWHEDETELVEAYLRRARRSIDEMFSSIRSSVVGSSLRVGCCGSIM